MKKEYIVTVADVLEGRTNNAKYFACPCCNHKDQQFPMSPLGRVMQIDVGKKCVKYPQYENWGVENTDQLRKRCSDNRQTPYFALTVEMAAYALLARLPEGAQVAKVGIKEGKVFAVARRADGEESEHPMDLRDDEIVKRLRGAGVYLPV